MSVSKRTKFLLSTLFVMLPLLGVAFMGRLGFNLVYWVAFDLVVLVVSTWWSQEFDFRWYEYIIYPIPLLLLVSLAWWLFISLSICPDLGCRVTDLRVWGFWLFNVGLLYSSLLTLNILNAATVRTVPLKQAALSTLYLLNLILTSVLSYGLVYNLALHHYHILILPVLFGFWSFIMALPLLYYATGRVRLIESIVLGLLATQVGLVVLFWPTRLLTRSILLVGSSAVFLGLTQHHLNRELTKNVRREYGLIGLVLILAFLLG